LNEIDEEDKVQFKSETSLLKLEIEQIYVELNLLIDYMKKLEETKANS